MLGTAGRAWPREENAPRDLEGGAAILGCVTGGKTCENGAPGPPKSIQMLKSVAPWLAPRPETLGLGFPIVRMRGCSFRCSSSSLDTNNIRGINDKHDSLPA